MKFPYLLAANLLLAPFAVRSQTTSLSIQVLYPSGTPTVNYNDDVLFEFVTVGDLALVNLCCGQGEASLPLLTPTATSTGVNHPTKTVDALSLGNLVSAMGLATSFPMTCAVTIWVGNTVSVTGWITGGEIVITSQSGQPAMEYAQSFTTILPQSSSSASNPPSTTGPVPSTNATAATQTQTTSSTLSPTPTLTSGDTGLSAGAKGGIAAGVIVGAALVAGLIAWGFISHQRVKKQTERLERLENEIRAGKPELPGESIALARGLRPDERDGHGAAQHEMPGSAAYHRAHAAGDGDQFHHDQPYELETSV